jgi:hypothetical protein
MNGRLEPWSTAPILSMARLSSSQLSANLDQSCRKAVWMTASAAAAPLRTVCHAGSGEDWADESNAMTTAEAQAFKRAASCYGLGRYLYNLAEMWVPLNEHRQPFEFPSLPQWALPKTGAPVKSHPASGPHPATVQRGPIDQRITGKIEGFRRILGDPIYGEILWRVARTQKANAIPNAQLQTNVAEAMERAARGIRKVHSLAESIGDTQFVSVLDRLHIGSMTTISNLKALRHLVSELEGLAGNPAA